MASWVRRVTDLFSPKPQAGPVPADTPAAGSPGTSATPPSLAPPTLPDLDAELFDWLLDISPGPRAAADDAERRWLGTIDTLTAADKGRCELLPRAAGVIPQLIHSLRDESQSAGELAQWVSRDANLVAEVTRLANSVGLRGADPVTELSDAVRRLGTSGVRQAIAKVVLKPMFDVHSGTLSSRAASRLWSHSQVQADLCRAIAVARGMDPFEAYLGGLLNNIGWAAGFRALERAFDGAPRPLNAGFSKGFKRGFQPRRDKLFVQCISAWDLNPALHAAAQQVAAANGFDNAASPLAQVLLAGHRLSSLRALSSAGRIALDVAALIDVWPENVRAAYAAS